MKHALVADDNTVSQRLLAGLLRPLGFQVDIVSDGRAAVRALAQRAYDLILMDCEMPTVSGHEATLAIRVREVDGALNHTPIIAVTAFSGEFSREQCLAVGMDAFLEKPVALEALRQAVRAVMPAPPAVAEDTLDNAAEA